MAIVLKQRAKNKIKISLLTEKIEKELGKKIVLSEDKKSKGLKLRDEQSVKNAIKLLVNKELGAGQALLMAKAINDSSYYLGDVELSDLFDKYKVLREYDGDLTGRVEQFLEKLGYVLTGEDVDVIKDPTEIGCILTKLFYSGKAQRYVSDKFIRAVAKKCMKNTKYLDETLIAITGGDTSKEVFDDQFSYFVDRAEPFIEVLKSKGMYS